MLHVSGSLVGFNFAVTCTKWTVGNGVLAYQGLFLIAEGGTVVGRKECVLRRFPKPDAEPIAWQGLQGTDDIDSSGQIVTNSQSRYMCLPYD